MPKMGSLSCVYIKQKREKYSEEVSERACGNVWKASSCYDHTGKNVKELFVICEQKSKLYLRITV